MTLAELFDKIGDLLEERPELADEEVIYKDYWGMEIKKLLVGQIGCDQFIQIW